MTSSRVYLTTAQLAKRWGVKPTTLRTWRCSKPMRGPPIFKPNGPRGKTLYKLTDVKVWEKHNTVRGNTGGEA